MPRSLSHPQRCWFTSILTCPLSVLECDASQYGIRAVISHRFTDRVERPIAYVSRSLSPAEKNYSQTEKEGLAIVFGVTKFYMYLFGRKFTLHTDHKPLLKIFSPQGATPVLATSCFQRWAILLSSYCSDIKNKSSSDIANAGALSQLPLEFKRDASVESPQQQQQHFIHSCTAYIHLNMEKKN